MNKQSMIKNSDFIALIPARSGSKGLKNKNLLKINKKTLVEIAITNALSSKKNYRKFRDRVGIKPYIYPLDKKTGFDIDHMDDFRLAEIMFKQKK